MKFLLRASALLGTYILIFSAQLAYASVSSGTIDASYKLTKVCHSADCTTPTPGVINFKPTGTTPVTIDDTNGIDGVAWGNELGWITFDPTGAEGLTINTTTGVISGKAWSQVSGWINFAPTGQSVSINSSGEFAGWAWAGGPHGGWIKFDCTDVTACIKTDWRPLSARSTTTPGGGNGPIAGGGGGGSSPSDMCWNVSGIQFSVPEGYTRVGNDCEQTALLASDMCQNISGIQTSVPAGLTRDTGGLCVASFIDIDHDGIPNTSDPDIDGDGIPNTQESGDSDGDGIPDAYESNIIDTDGDGIKDYLDPQDDGEGAVTSGEQMPVPQNPFADTDGDGIPNYLDPITNTIPGMGGGDSDNDGIADAIECPRGFVCPDTDGDGIPDYMDAARVNPQTDSDGDGVPDALERGDSDNDSVPDAFEPNNVDTDGDGIPNYLDPDDDGDGYPTITERTPSTSPLETDFDNDGIPAFLDAIFNGPMAREENQPAKNPVDTKQPTKPKTPAPAPDPVPELAETDAPFTPEPSVIVEEISDVPLNDADADGIPDTVDPVVASSARQLGGDSDGDGIPDAKECVGGYPCPDLNNDGLPNYMDPDDDGDGLSSSEDADADNDGVPNKDDATPHGDRTESYTSPFALAPTQSNAGEVGTIVFNFMPAFAQIPVKSEFIVSMLRAITGGEPETALLTDTNPSSSADETSVDIFGLVAVVLGGIVFPLWLFYALASLFVGLLWGSWGTIYDAQTGTAIQAARVMLYDLTGNLISETISDSSGNYSFKARKGQYQLRVQVPQYSQVHHQGVTGVYDGGIISVGMFGRPSAHIPMHKVNQS